MAAKSPVRALVFYATSNLVYEVNFDGTGLHLVDMWQGGGGAQVDISADGSKILSSEGGTARVVNADGGNPHQVIQVEFRMHGELPASRPMARKCISPSADILQPRPTPAIREPAFMR